MSGLLRSTSHQTVIIGAGVVGSTLALCLARRGMPVTLIDAQDPLKTISSTDEHILPRDSRVWAMSPHSLQLLQQAGISDYITRQAPYQQMHVWVRDGVSELKFCDDGKNLGSMIEPNVLSAAIADAIKQLPKQTPLTYLPYTRVSQVDWLDGQRVCRIEMETDTSKVDASWLNDRQSADYLEADLLVGADGRRSFTRRLLGIRCQRLDYHQTAICAAIKTQRPHDGIARQVFLPRGPLALLPLADSSPASDSKGHWQSIVWTLPTNQALELLASPDTLAEQVSRASQYILGQVTQIESVASFALTASHAKTYHRHQGVLIGDAAHGVHPLAGQGLNLGLLDVAALVDCLFKDYQRSGQRLWGHSQTLVTYERRRYWHNAAMMHSFSALGFLFASHLPLLDWLRNEGVLALNHFDAFQHKHGRKGVLDWFTQRASGL